MESIDFRGSDIVSSSSSTASGGIGTAAAPGGRLWYGLLKRGFDVAAAGVGLVLLLPLFGLVALAIRIDSPGPVFFRQTRVGRHFRHFQIYKFRSMIAAAPQVGPLLTAGDDARITRVGRLLRWTKIDELPQLLNVLRGEMSLVGPRPEVPRYVERFREDYAEILTVRPGITDPASLAFRHESAQLGAAADPEDEYVTRILPEKLRLSRESIRRASLLRDVAVIVRTLVGLWH